MTTEADVALYPGSPCGESAISKRSLDPARITEELPELTLPVSSLAPGLYLRQGGTSAAHVQLLADAAGSAKLPPVLVQTRGWRMIDGMHRLEAAKLRGEENISARLVDCTDEEAVVLAIKLNTLHGLPLSRSDRISGARRVLASHPDWSDRAVAEVTGLSAKTIALLRNRSTDDARLFTKRIGRDGKRRPVAGADGRRRAAEYINAHPNASLRQIAREADVSIGTVHDVRSRIRRGMDPLKGSRTRPQQRLTGCAQGTISELPTPVKGAAPVKSLELRPKSPAAKRLAWSAISSKLASDPTLRYKEDGRTFFRWMALHATQTEEWMNFIDAIPVHWLSDISLIADNISDEWRKFAEQLRSRREFAS